MKVYVASKFEEAPRVRSVMEQLRAAGHTITFDWTQEIVPDVTQAQSDMEGIRDCDAFILIAEKPLRYCGALTELGMALAWNKIIYLVGHAIDMDSDLPNIFTLLPSVRRDIETLL